MDGKTYIRLDLAEQVDYGRTRKIISSIIPMYNLTVEGIEEAMDYLRTGGKNQYTTVQMLKGLNY